MRSEARFSAFADDYGLSVTFDDGRTTHYDSSVSETLRAILDRSSGEQTAFSAHTIASFLEAEHAEPSPAGEGPLVELARDSARAVRPSTDIALGSLLTDSSRPLAEVLNDRRSHRELGPLALEELATVLVRAGRVVDWTYDEDGFEVSLRPHPSAGAIHPLVIHVIADHVDGLAQGCWEFDPFRCSLMPSDLEATEVNRARATITAAAHVGDPPAMLVLVAQPARTLRRYPRGTAHIWRDAGVLLMTLHLVATDLGLGSTIVGTSGALRRFDRAGGGTVDVGALVVGRPIARTRNQDEELV